MLNNNIYNLNYEPKDPALTRLLKRYDVPNVISASNFKNDNTSKQFKFLNIKNSENVERSYFLTLYSLNLAIVDQIESLFPLAVQSVKDHKNYYPDGLNTPIGVKKLTPLHIAVISGKNFYAAELLNKGADVNRVDHAGWTALHHAAFLGNRAMVDILLYNGAKPDSKNMHGGTYKDIQNLTRRVKQVANQSIPFLYQESNGEIVRLTQARYSKLTNSEYRFENLIDVGRLFNQWSTRQKDVNPMLFDIAPFLKQYREFIKNRTPNILYKVLSDSEGNKVSSEVGLGVKASEEYSSGKVIGEYIGHFCSKNSNTDERSQYELNGIDAKKYSSDISRINDGFPNICVVPLNNVNGLSTRKVFVTSNKIKKGEQICWSYGFNPVKIFYPYTELRGKELREFFKGRDVSHLIKLLLKDAMGQKMTFKEVILAEKMRYLIQAPAALYRMILDGSLTSGQINEIKKFLSMPMIFDVYCPKRPDPINKMIELPLKILEIFNKLKGKGSNAANIVEVANAARDFLQYSIDLPIQLSITTAIDNMDQACNIINKSDYTGEEVEYFPLLWANFKEKMQKAINSKKN